MVQASQGPKGPYEAKRHHTVPALAARQRDKPQPPSYG